VDASILLDGLRERTGAEALERKDGL